MKHLVAVTVLGCACIGYAQPVKRVCASGGTAEFRAFLAESAGAPCELFESPEALPFESAEQTLFVIMPRYPHKRTVLESFPTNLLARLQASAKRGNRFYFENIVSTSKTEQTFFGVRMLGTKQEPFEQKVVETGVGVLQSRKESYRPAVLFTGGKVRDRARALASASDAIGVNAIFRPGNERLPVVVASADGARVVSLFRLAPYDSRFMRPYARWREFYVKLFAPLLGVDEKTVLERFVKIWPDFIRSSVAVDNDTPVKRALAWHEKSGILFKPDGTAGMREAVESDNLLWRKCLRTDVNLMTGALFARAGKVYGREDWVILGRNLVDHMLARGNLTDDGYFRWFDKNGGSYSSYAVYATDHGRALMALVNLCEVTDDMRYRELARKAADAFMRWQDEKGLIGVWFDLRAKLYPPKGDSSYNPVCYYDNIPALFKLADLTGEAKYREAALRTVRTMSAKFPDLDLGNGAFYSANSVYGRYLLIAAAAQRATDDDFSKKINEVLDFYDRTQAPAGGIAEIPIRLIAHDEAGVGIGDGSDHIADLLYCNNFSFAGLSVLMKLPVKKRKGVDMVRVQRIYGRLRDFLVRVQISSDDPKFDGAWMRAYDMDLGEYHGLNKDAGWGPYCIEAGWTMGTIPAVLLFDGRDDSYF